MSAEGSTSAPVTHLWTREHFLSFLFGKESTHGLANGLLNEATWRGHRRKIWDRYWAAVREKDLAGFVRWFRTTHPDRFASLVV